MKEYFKQIFSKRFLTHLGLAIASLLLIAYLVLLSLDFYTNHGDSIEVPELKGLQFEQAKVMLDNSELGYQIIDSVYMPDKKPGIIIEQTPAAHEKIKRYRQVYLVINSYKKPLISLPDVRDLSYRNAKATLEALGFKIDSIQYVPSEYKDLVKDVKSYSRVIAPGTRIQTGARLILVVGLGTLGEERPVPSLRGLKYEAAIQLAHADSLNIRSATFDVLPKNAADSAQFFVFKQTPIKGTPIPMGASIDIWLTKDKSLLEEPEEEYIPKDSIPQPANKKDIEEFSF